MRLIWKLVCLILPIALTLFLVCANLHNSSDVSFWFYTFKDVPVFLTMFVSFFAGVAFALPFSFFVRIFKRKPRAKVKSEPKMPKKNYDSSKKITQSITSKDIIPQQSADSAEVAPEIKY